MTVPNTFATGPKKQGSIKFMTCFLIFPDFDSLKIPFFLRSDNQYIVKSADFFRVNRITFSCL